MREQRSGADADELDSGALLPSRGAESMFPPSGSSFEPTVFAGRDGRMHLRHSNRSYKAPKSTHIAIGRACVHWSDERGCCVEQNGLTEHWVAETIPRLSERARRDRPGERALRCARGELRVLEALACGGLVPDRLIGRVDPRDRKVYSRRGQLHVTASNMLFRAPEDTKASRETYVTATLVRSSRGGIAASIAIKETLENGKKIVHRETWERWREGER